MSFPVCCKWRRYWPADSSWHEIRIRFPLLLSLDVDWSTVSLLLNWVSLQIRRCRSRIQVFRVCYLSSRSVVSECISNFLRVTGTSSHLVNSAKALMCLGCTKGQHHRNSRDCFSTWKWKGHRWQRLARQCTRGICRFSHSCYSKQHENQPSLIFRKEQADWGIHREM